MMHFTPPPIPPERRRPRLRVAPAVWAFAIVVSVVVAALLLGVAVGRSG